MGSTLTLVLLLAGVLTFLVLAGSLFLIRRAQRERVDGTYFESSQGPIFYKVAGSKGPWVMLLHGLGESSYIWRNIVPELSKHYRVINLDLWGFGHSSKKLANPMTLHSQTAVLQDFTSSLNIKRLHLVGHSMGGEIALWFAMQDDRIDKCITIAPAAHPSLVPNILTLFSWVANWTPLVLSRAGIKRLLARVITDNSFITEEMVENYYAPYQDPEAHISFAASLAVIRDNSVYENLAHFRGNTMMLWGANDKVIPAKAVQDIKSRTPTTQHFTHPTAGHSPIEDDHHWVLAQVVRFLKS